jgi:hypothetical protein
MLYVILRSWPARTARAQRAASGEAARPPSTQYAVSNSVISNNLPAWHGTTPAAKPPLN